MTHTEAAPTNVMLPYVRGRKATQFNNRQRKPRKIREATDLTTTAYPKQIVSAENEPRILRSGRWSPKLGGRVLKGKWVGMPIYSLTLVERETCPTDCPMLVTCYGNNMNWSRRFRVDDAFMAALQDNLAALNDKHPQGFVVRLHVLGDFPHLEYVRAWIKWLRAFPALHVFGYTARRPDTLIGWAIAAQAEFEWDRFALRTSHYEGGAARSIVVKTAEDAGDAIICPAQLRDDRFCGNCGLCWQTRKTIAFLEH